MTKHRRINALLILAMEDVNAAKTLAETGNRNASYHCQQGAEKLLKAILLDRNIQTGVEHRLDVLVTKLPDTDPWKATLNPLSRLTPFATTFRYPTPGGRIPEGLSPAQAFAEANILADLIARVRRELLRNE